MSVPTRLAHYEILEQIGAGGMGAVYRARDTKLDRDVALKILPPDLATDPERTRRFAREAKAVAALNHPNIVSVYSVEHEEGIHFLTMELVEGRSLDTFIPDDGMPLDDLLKYAIPLADAVASAHEQGITHRDLKPQNVMVSNKGRLKVLDFGLAKMAPAAVTDDDATRSLVTQAEGRVVGTVPYMSPEQAQGLDVDPRSDVFTLGIMLHEMATGKRPFTGDTSMSTITSILRDEPAPIHELCPRFPPELSRIQRRALAKDRERRYETALGLRNDLEDLREGRTREDSHPPAEPAPAGLPVAASAGPRSARLLVPAAVLALLLVVILVVKPFQGRVESDPVTVPGTGALAVLFFDNLENPADPDRVGAIVTNLLTTGLSQAEHLSMVSSQRLNAVQQAGGGAPSAMDRESAGALAIQAGADRFVLGSILETSPRFVITSQLVDAHAGTILKAHRVDGEPGESLFAVVDRLIVEVKQALGVPGAAEADLSVASVTTHSVEAYRHYLSGVENLERLDVVAARADLEQAVAIDSTFAMAYYQLASPALVQLGGMANEEQQEAARRAARLADQVTQRERHYILARAAVLDGDYDEAIAELEALVSEFPDETPAYALLADLHGKHRHDRQARIDWLLRWAEADPGDKSAYNALAYAYPAIGDFEKAIWALNQYIRLAPDEANPYDTRGDYYAMMGDLDKARDSFETAIRKDPTFLSSRIGLANILNEQGETERAREVCLEALEQSRDASGRAVFRFMLAYIPARGGRLREAIEILDAGMRSDEMDGYRETWYRWKLGLRGRLYHYLGEYDRADADLRRAIELGAEAKDSNTYMSWAGLVMSLMERGDLKAAERELEGFREFVEGEGKRHTDVYRLCRGWLAMARGNPQEAFSDFQQARQVTDSMFLVFHSLGMGHLALGRAEDAVRELELVTRGTHSSERDAPVQSALAIYHLGLAYEAAGRPGDAVREYERFLETFEGAEPVFEEVGDARMRLDRLRPAS